MLSANQHGEIFACILLEPERVHRVFNEMLLLLRNPALDHLFRNPDTGKLKEQFTFIVDNGPSEVIEPFGMNAAGPFSEDTEIEISNSNCYKLTVLDFLAISLQYLCSI